MEKEERQPEEERGTERGRRRRDDGEMQRMRGECEKEKDREKGARKREDNKGEEMRGQGDREMEIELLGGEMHYSCPGVSVGVWAKGQWELSLGCLWGYLTVHTARSFPSILVGEYASVWSFPVSA